MSLAARLARVGELLATMAASPVPTHLFQTLADGAAAALPHDYLAVALDDPEADGYRVHPLAPAPGEAVTARVFGRHEGTPGHAMRTGRARVIGDLAADAAGVDDLEGALARGGLGSAVVVPVRRGLEVPGALLFAARGRNRYGPDDARVAGLIAAGVASALESSRAYHALADEQSTLAAVLASTADAVLVVDPDGLVLLANPAVRGMLGGDPETMPGRPLKDVVDVPALCRLLEAPDAPPAEVALADGRTAQATVVPVVTPYGERVGRAAVLRDITLLKDLERMKNDFVATVSHDLRNPITVIGGLAHVILQSAEDPALRKRCEAIRDTARYMGEMVRDLLDLGRIEAGLDAPREPTDAVAVIADVLAALAPEAEARGQAIATALPAEAWVLAARGRLRQVLANLVGNALKYTPPGGRVTVTLAAGAGEFTIAVADTGIGIPAADLPHVFDKFYRVQSAATRDIAGTGLGLAIVKSLVEAHGGRVRAESVEGAGSTFFVDLPRPHPR